MTYCFEVWLFAGNMGKIREMNIILLCKLTALPLCGP
jgi:hypothetical protein